MCPPLAHILRYWCSGEEPCDCNQCRRKRRRSDRDRRSSWQRQRNRNEAPMDVDVPLIPVSPAERRASSSPILFYERDRPYFEFTNFSPNPVSFQGLIYPTSEHLFQAHKFLDENPQFAEHIRTQPTARAALQEATRLKRFQRSDWFDVNRDVMDTVLEAKFTQDGRLSRMLLDTGDRQLIEDSPVDAFWGVGSDGQGRNELGKALMRLREKLRRHSR